MAHTSRPAACMALICLLHNTANAAVNIAAYTNLNDPAVAKLMQGNTAVLTLPPDSAYSKGIASSFLGLSIDLDDAVALGVKDYQTLLQDLHAYGHGPLRIRVGGYLLDKSTTPVPAKFWQAMKAARNACPITYQVDVNMWSEDPALTRRQVADIFKNLPKEAVVTVGVGNEPDMYALPCEPQGCGEYLPKATTWLGEKWMPLSQKVFPAANAEAKKMLSGPNWSTLKMRPDTLEYWLRSTSAYLNMVTVHHYVSGIADPTKIAVPVPELLDDATTAERMRNLQKLVDTAWKYGQLPLRITECNSISYGGNDGVSNVMAAALWAVDTMFQVAATGAVGIDFHQVVTERGGANYNALEFFPTDINTVRVKPQFYGYLFWQKATRGTSAGSGAIKMVPQPGGSKYCKAWFVKSMNDGALRISVINKADLKPCLVHVKLTAAEMTQYRSQATADFLFAEQGLYERLRIYFSGMTYAYRGATKVGQVIPESVPRYETKSGSAVTGGGFLVEMAPGTQAMTLTLARA